MVSFLYAIYVVNKEKIKKADRSFEEYSFIDAITPCKELVDNGNMSEELLEKLGDAYYIHPL